MKKLLSVLLAAMTLFAALNAAHAEEEIKVSLDGSEIAFDVPPRIIDGRTLVPMRAIFEALGTKVLWDDTTKTVTAEKGGTDIIMTIGAEMMFVNYSPVTLDVPPMITDGRTLVPVRAIAESFDCDVRWDGEAKTVFITTSEEQAENNPRETMTEFPITYDDSAEATSEDVKNFNLTDVTQNDDGKYEITYTVDTYRESSGDVIVSFDCFDVAGRRIDGFSKLFFAYAYCWTPQKASAVISDKTATIKLADNQ